MRGVNSACRCRSSMKMMNTRPEISAGGLVTGTMMPSEMTGVGRTAGALMSRPPRNGLKVSIFCSTPSSKIWNSVFFRSDTNRLLASRGVMSEVT